MTSVVHDLKGNRQLLYYGGELFLNIDCMDLLKEMPNKSIDLALVDPPYGHALDGDKVTRTGGGWSKRHQGDGECIDEWDIAPPKEYFDELFRVSKEQIVWGGNYFTQFLPPSRCFVVWYKPTVAPDFSMAMAEYAWASCNENAKVYVGVPQGTAKERRIHACQKPVALYEFCLQQFAKPGMTVLDTHVGSGSSLIACHKYGCHYIGSEINPIFYERTKARLERAFVQNYLFDMTEV